MRTDTYLRAVLTVIAGALVYLCVVLTPWPVVQAQRTMPGALRPGDSTGPAEMVIVGWRIPQGSAFPVQVSGPVNVTGDVKVANDIRVSGRVQTQQAPETTNRVVLIGWENNARPASGGAFEPLRTDAPAPPGLPVSPR